MSLRILACIAALAPLALPAQEVVRQSAPVVIANRMIIELHGPIAGHTAEERAQGSIARIETALDADPKAEVSYGETEEGTRVRVGGHHAFTVTRIDIDPEIGETTLIVAREAVGRLEQAIVERREQHSPGYLLRSAAYAAAATLVYGLLVWGLFRGARWVEQRISAMADEKARKLHLGSVRRIARVGVTMLTWTIAILASISWAAYVLEQFPFTRRWGENLASNLLEVAARVALAIAGALPGLLLVVIIFLLARAVIGLVKVFFLRVEFGRIQLDWLDAETVGPTRRIFNLVVWLFAAAIAYPYLPGAQTEAFKGLSVLLGLMLSLGGASVIGQAFSGLILMYSRTFRRGDYVRIGDTEGTVVMLGLFATRIRTGLGEEVTLSNAGIMAKSIKNHSRAVEGTGYVIDTSVTIGYGTPWRQVEAMLLEAARRTADIVQEPRPFVRQTSLSDFYVEYRLIAYTPLEHPAPRIEVLSRLHGNIQDVFNEYGVQIMSPHYRSDPTEPQVVPKVEWYAPPAQPPAQTKT